MSTDLATNLGLLAGVSVAEARSDRLTSSSAMGPTESMSCWGIPQSDSR